MGASAVSRDLILEQQARVLASSLFQGAVRSRALLRFIVEESLDGRTDRLKEYTIGAEALGRGDSFDPRTDPIVRAEASRLRGRLERYYAAEGRADPIVILLPKGSYVPQFLDQKLAAATAPNHALAQKAFRSRMPIWIGAGTLIAACALVIGWWVPQHLKRPSGSQLIQFDVELQSLGSLGSEVGTDVILSPDGARLVFVSRGTDGVPRLNTRRLNQSQATQLIGTEGARSAFFSSDGGWVGFWAAGKLMKVPVEGGSPVVLCETNDLLGGSWGEDGNIIAAVGGGKLLRVSSAGGASATVLDLTGERAFPAWPQVLPKSDLVLFTTIGLTGPNGATIEALSFSTGKRTVLARGGTFGRYLSNGYLTYVNQGTLFAAPFDLDRMQASGTATPVLDHVSYSSAFGFAQLDFSQTGTLVYRKDNEEQVVVEVQDGAGRAEPLLAKPGHYLWPRLSPDGQRLAFFETESGAPGVSVYERRSGRTTHLATPKGTYLPMWTRDDRYLIVGGLAGLSWIRVDGTAKSEPLIQGNHVQVPWSLSPDGSRLAYHELNPVTGFDLWTVPIQVSKTGVTAGKPEPFLRTAAYETYPSFSPDGKWIAYGSNESGSWEVYVRPFPDRGERMQVSVDGGRIPFWSPNGHELLYRTDDQRIMVRAYRTKGNLFILQELRSWSPSRLADTGVLANLDLTSDGQRFAMLTPASTVESRQSENHATFMLNFSSEVQRRLLTASR